MTLKLRLFIRIGNKIINTNMIKTINISPTQYNIELISNNSGSSGFFIYGSGVINNNNSNETITIFKEESPEDYKYVTEWIINATKQSL